MTQVNTSVLVGKSAKDTLALLQAGAVTPAQALARANHHLAKGLKGFKLRGWNAVVQACGGTPTPAPAQEDTRTADAIAQAQVAFAQAPQHFLTRAKVKLATGKGILTREEKIALVKALG